MSRRAGADMKTKIESIREYLTSRSRVMRSAFRWANRPIHPTNRGAIR